MAAENTGHKRFDEPAGGGKHLRCVSLFVDRDTRADGLCSLVLVENARNLSKKENLPLTVNHYLNNLSLLTNQVTPDNYRDGNRQRIYMKDIDCPDKWRDRLRTVLPPFVFYMNDSSSTDPNDKGFAPAGDLMSSLPQECRAQNLQGYIGHEGTYTPCHRDMCASLGQNIMVETSHDGHEDGKATVAGSSLWFMAESNGRAAVAEYFRSKLGHDIETEYHFAQLDAWKSAPFQVYIVEQRAGDFILVPPLAPHQVWNRGTRTMKIAWNRTTPDTLELAFKEALHNARLVCRDEQYQCKAIVHYSLDKYSRLLREAKEAQVVTSKLRHLKKDFKRLFTLYTGILLSESFSQKPTKPKTMEFLPFQSNVACEFCRCNIFNRFLTCKRCAVKLVTGDEETYDICMECYSLGRSCSCVSKLTWCEQFKWKDLKAFHSKYREQIIEFEAAAGKDVSTRFRPLDVEHDERPHKTLAEICQEELKRRPFNDPEKQQKPVVDEAMDEIDDSGRIIRKRRKLKDGHIAKKNHSYCHFCRTLDPSWKVASCAECNSHYCYDILYRAFDTLPPTTMQDPHWKCPKCRKVCSCNACARDPETKPYRPTFTILGHDTLKIAHYKSVQTLVDFSRSNISWILKIDNARHNQRPEESSIERRAVATEKGTTRATEKSILRLQEFTSSHNDTNDNNQHDTANLIRMAEQAVGHPSMATNHDEHISFQDDNHNTPVDPALAIQDEDGDWKLCDNIFNDRFKASEAAYLGYGNENEPGDRAEQYRLSDSCQELRTIDPKVIQTAADEDNTDFKIVRLPSSPSTSTTPRKQEMAASADWLHDQNLAKTALT